MTNKPKTLFEERVSTVAGAQAQAAAGLAFQVTRLLSLALRRSGLAQQDVAARLGITEGRVSQVINGDGNVHIATMGRFMHALGYGVELRAVPTGPGTPPIEPRTSRRRGAHSADNVDVFHQKFITPHGPVDVTMWMPTDDVLGCVPAGTLEHVGQFPVDTQVKGPAVRVHTSGANVWGTTGAHALGTVKLKRPVEANATHGH